MRGFLLLLALGASSARAGVVINEVFPDPVGTDTEWVELYNPDDGDGADVDISGWTLYKAGPSFTLVYTFPANTILAGASYLVIGEAAVSSATLTTTLDLDNGATTGAGVRIEDTNRNVIDTVIWGVNNSNSLPDDASGVTFGPAPAQGQSVGRIPNGDDTDDNSVDLGLIATPTPGADNPTLTATDTDTDTDTTETDTDTDTSGGGSVLVINEFLANPTGTDLGQEWLELANTGTGAVDVTGYSLEIADSGATWRRVHLFGNGSVDALGYYVVGESGVSGTDEDTAGRPLELPNAASNADGIRLLDSTGAVLDTVLFGSTNPDALTDDDGDTTQLAVMPNEGEVLARIPDGQDTDDCSFDFEVRSGTLGWANGGVAPTDSDTDTWPDIVQGPVINELVPAVTGDDTGNEWVEILNTTSGSYDLTGWTLEVATGNVWTTAFTFGAVALDGQKRLVVGGANVTGADYTVADLGLGDGGSDADGVRLTDGTGRISDTVIYGTPNTDQLRDDGGSVASSLAPTPVDDQSLSRSPDGFDTDASGVDFVLAASPTLGAHNDGLPTDTDTDTDTDTPTDEVFPTDTDTDTDTGPQLYGVVINEFASAETGGGEWIELLNMGATGINVAHWTLWVGDASGNWTQVYQLPDTQPTLVDLKPRQRLLIGDNGFSGADFNLAGNLSLPDGTGDAVAIRLDDATGRGTVDIVIYSSNATNTAAYETEDGVVANSLAFAPTAGESLARIPDGFDTNDSGFDFSVRATPTPGDSNGCTGIDTDGDGVFDCDDLCPNASSLACDQDGDGCFDDGDQDGVGDCTDVCPAQAADVCDLDSDGCIDDGDGDGLHDCADVCPTIDASTCDDDNDGCFDDEDGDGIDDCTDACPVQDASSCDLDSDGCLDDDDHDGVIECFDTCPGVDASSCDLDGDGCFDDDDGDGVNNCLDLCASEDASACDTNVDGCLDDGDGDGIVTCSDSCPTENASSCDSNTDGCLDDGDGDGVDDCNDSCPSDGVTTCDPDLDGCDNDADSDGVLDCADSCPNVDASACDTSPADGCIDDDDGDQVSDCNDSCPGVVGNDCDADSDGCADDVDNDGTVDCVDSCIDLGVTCDVNPADGCQDDVDMDGVSDCDDTCVNTAAGSCDLDNDGCPDDADGDGLLDCDDTCPAQDASACDQNNDGCLDDADFDGVLDCGDDLCLSEDARACDQNNDGCLDETDGDGLLDCVDTCPSENASACDNNPVDGCLDDRDGDGVPDCTDSCPNSDASACDVNQNGCIDDIDGDGIHDCDDLCDGEDSTACDQNSDGCLDNSDADPILDCDDLCKIDDATACDRNNDGCLDDADGDQMHDCDDQCPNVHHGGVECPPADGCPDDADGDGVLDCNDSCPSEDASSCDTSPADGCLDDADNDTVDDCNDVCPGGDDTVDTDLDGTPDACDTPEDTDTDTDTDTDERTVDDGPTTRTPGDDPPPAKDTDVDGVAGGAGCNCDSAGGVSPGWLVLLAALRRRRD